VIIPILLSWIKQPHILASKRINRIDPRALEPVTHAAGEPEIVFIVGAAVGFWKDVVDFQWGEYVTLRALAIPAPMISLHADARSQFLGDTHGSRGGRNLRRTASLSP
jgi:hypothetical protein